MKGDEQTNSIGIYTHNSYKNKGSHQQRRDQQQALVFRTRQENSIVTKLLDAHGNKRVIRQHGKMGLIKHVNILSALEMIALRYHNKGHAKTYQDKILYYEAMDEIGTINTAELSDFDADALGGTISENFSSNNIRNDGNYGDSR